MRDRWKRWMQSLRSRLLGVWQWTAKYSAELATAAAGLAGWGFLTWGFALLYGPIIWIFGAGLLCISLFGWRLFITVCLDGLYALTHPPAEK